MMFTLVGSDCEPSKLRIKRGSLLTPGRNPFFSFVVSSSFGGLPPTKCRVFPCSFASSLSSASISAGGSVRRHSPPEDL